MNKIKFFFFTTLIIFLLPYLYVFKEFSRFQLDWHYFVKMYSYCGWQALLSTALTLLLSFPCAMGLFWLRKNSSSAITGLVEYVILLPSLLPRLFVLVSVLSLIPFFPFGLAGVVILHALSELGLASLIMHRLLQNHLSAYMEMSEMMGVSRIKFLRTALPLIAPQLLQIGFVLFLFFLSSVSIPLILAGGQYSSLEAVIYQKIVVAHDWNQALNLFGIQMVLIVLLLMVLGAIPITQSENRIRITSNFLSHPLGLLLLAIPMGLIFLSLIIKLPLGLISLSQQSYILEGWDVFFMGTLFIGFVSGGLSFLGLTIISCFYQVRQLRKWFPLIVTPSSVVLAFAFFLLPGRTPLALYVKLSCALSLSFLPALMRFGLLQKLDKFNEHVDVASLMGARFWKIFSLGVWPQILPQISLLSGLGAMWAMGDFAVSRVIAGRDLTLAMWTQSLVDQYRWDLALLLSWMILFAGSLVYFFFWSLSYVSHKKLKQVL